MSGHRIGTDMMLAATSGALKLKDPGDTGTIKAKESPQFLSLITGGAETRTLADPDAGGQILIIGFETDNGNCVVTYANTYNQTGNNTATFADIGDMQVLVSIKEGANYVWREVANDGAGLSTV
jgi:hypothetical protein